MSNRNIDCKLSMIAGDVLGISVRDTIINYHDRASISYIEDILLSAIQNKVQSLKAKIAEQQGTITSQRSWIDELVKEDEERRAKT